MHPTNGRVVDGLVIGAMICPSTPLPPLYPVGSFHLMMPSYVGIAGATDDDDFHEDRVDICCVPLKDGQIAAGGVLVANRAVAAKEIVDGMSKTIAVGEESDYVTDGNSVPFRIDAGFPSGWIMGTIVRGTPPDYSAPFPAWNITTIRYPPNTTRYNLPGVEQARGPNNPLVSPHPGGVNVLFTAGSAAFLSEEIDTPTLKRLSTRDDAEAASAGY
jgi:hypothetical protein